MYLYEQIIRIPYYGVYMINTGTLQFYNLVKGAYQPVEPNSCGHYPIKPLGVELGQRHRKLSWRKPTMVTLVGQKWQLVAHRLGEN